MPRSLPAKSYKLTEAFRIHTIGSHAIEYSEAHVDSLRAWYRFEDTNTSKRLDKLDDSAPGSFNDGSYHGDVYATLDSPSSLDTSEMYRSVRFSQNYDASGNFIGEMPYATIGESEKWNGIIGTNGTMKLTISAWVMPESSGKSGRGTIIQLGGQAPPDVDPGTSGIRLFTYDGQIPNEPSRINSIGYRADFSDVDYVATTDSNVFTPGEWVHIAVTHDLSSTIVTETSDLMGSSEIEVERPNDPIIYINGEKVEFSKQHPSSDDTGRGLFEGIQGGYQGLCLIGNAATNDTVLNRLFDGTIDEIAIWDSILDEVAIQAVYHSRIGVPDVSSGFLNNPVKVLQHQNDCESGAYPGILRHGPSRMFGNDPTRPFDDTKTIPFNSAYASAWVYFTGRPRDASVITLFDPAGGLDLLPAVSRRNNLLNDLSASANQDLKAEQIYLVKIAAKGMFGEVFQADGINHLFPSSDNPKLSGPWVGIKNLTSIDIDEVGSDPYNIEYGIPEEYLADANSHTGIQCTIYIESYGLPDLAVDGDGIPGTFSVLLEGTSGELFRLGTGATKELTPGSGEMFIDSPIPMNDSAEYIIDLATPEQQIYAAGILDGLKIEWPNPFNSDFGSTSGDTGDTADQTVQEIWESGSDLITQEQLIMYIAEPQGLDADGNLADVALTNTDGYILDEDGNYTYPDLGEIPGAGSNSYEDEIQQLYRPLITTDVADDDHFTVILDSPDKFQWKKANLVDYKFKNNWTDYSEVSFIGRGSVKLEYTTAGLRSSRTDADKYIYADPISLGEVDTVSGSIPTSFSINAYARGDISSGNDDEYYQVEYSFHNNASAPMGSDPSSEWVSIGSITSLISAQMTSCPDGGCEDTATYEYSEYLEDDPDLGQYVGRWSGPMSYAPFADGRTFSMQELKFVTPGYGSMPDHPHITYDFPDTFTIPESLDYVQAHTAGEITDTEFLTYVAVPAGIIDGVAFHDVTARLSEATEGYGSHNSYDVYSASKLYVRYKVGTGVSWGRCQVKLRIAYTGRFWYFDDIDNEDGSGNNIRLNWGSFTGHNVNDMWKINVEDSTKETFEFQRGKISNRVNTTVNVRGLKTRDAVNSRFARAVNRSGLQINAFNDGKKVWLYQTTPGEVGNLEIHADKRSRCWVSNSKKFNADAVGQITGSFSGGTDYRVSYPTTLPAQVQLTDPNGNLIWKDGLGKVASAEQAGMRKDPFGLNSSGQKLYRGANSGVVVTAIDLGYPTGSDSYYRYYDDSGAEITDPDKEPWSTYKFYRQMPYGAYKTEAEYVSEHASSVWHTEVETFSPASLTEEEWLQNEGLVIPAYPDSPWRVERIATPHSESHLISTGSTSKGVADIGISFEQSFGNKDSSPFAPFADDRVDIDVENEFYDEGIPAEIYEGLSAPLKSKTQIVIPLNTIAPTTFGYDKQQRYSWQNNEVFGTGIQQHLFNFYYEFGLNPWLGVTDENPIPYLELDSDLVLNHETTNKVSFFGRGDIDQNQPNEYYDIGITWGGLDIIPLPGNANTYIYSDDWDTNIHGNKNDYNDLIVTSGDVIERRIEGLHTDRPWANWARFNHDEPHHTLIFPAGKITKIAVTAGEGVSVGMNQVLVKLNPRAYTYSSVEGEDPVPGTGASPGSKETKIFNHMVYYNFNTQTWEPIGPGVSTQVSGSEGHQQFFEDACIGFSRGVELMQSGSATACLPITNFGFPAHPKFAAANSQQLNLSDHIIRPFVLEKFVLEFEAAWAEGEDFPKRSIMYEVNADGKILRTDDNENYYNKAAINNFFILNQRSWRGAYNYRSEGQSLTYWYYPSYQTRVTSGHTQPRMNRYMWDGSDYPYDKNRYLTSWFRFNYRSTGQTCIDNNDVPEYHECLEVELDSGVYESFPLVGLFGNSIDKSGALPELVSNQSENPDHSPPPQVNGESPWKLPVGVDSTDYDYSIKLDGKEQWLKASVNDLLGSDHPNFEEEFFQNIQTGDTSSYYYNKGTFTNRNEQDSTTADYDPNDESTNTIWCYQQDFDPFEPELEHPDNEDHYGVGPYNWQRRDFVMLPINPDQEPGNWKHGLRIWNDNPAAAGGYTYMYNRRIYRTRPITGKRTITYNFVQAPGTNINQELTDGPDPAMETKLRPDGTPYGSEALRFQVRHELGESGDYSDWIDLVVHEPDYTKRGAWQRTSVVIDPEAIFGDADQEYYIRFAQDAATYPDVWMISDVNVRFSFSVGLWFKSGGTTSRVSNLLSIADVEGRPNKIWLSLYQNKLHLMVDTGKNKVYRRGNTPDEMVDGEWHHAIFTYNHTTFTNRLHVDGDFIAEYKLPQKTDDDGDFLWLKGSEQVTTATADVTEQDLYDFGITNTAGTQVFFDDVFTGIDTTGDGEADILAADIHEFNGTEVRTIEGVDIILIEEDYMQALGYAPILPWEFELSDLAVFGADIDSHKFKKITGVNWNSISDYAGNRINLVTNDVYKDYSLDEPPFKRSQLNSALLAAQPNATKFPSLDSVTSTHEFEEVMTYDNFYKGSLSDIAVWSTPLSGLDARALYHLSQGGYYKKGLGTDVSLSGVAPFQFSVPLDTDFDIRIPSSHEAAAKGGFIRPWNDEGKYARYDISHKLLARYLVDPNNYKIIESPDFRDTSVSDDLTAVLVGSPDYSDDGPWILPDEPSDIRVLNNLRYSMNFHDNNFFLQLPRAKDLWTPSDIEQWQMSRDEALALTNVRSYPEFSVFAWIKVDPEQDKADPVIFSINTKSGKNRLIFFIDTADTADSGAIGDRLCIHVSAMPNDLRRGVHGEYTNHYGEAPTSKWDDWYRITTNRISSADIDGHKNIKDGKWHHVGFTYKPATGNDISTYSGDEPILSTDSRSQWEIYVDGYPQQVHRIENLDVKGPKNDVFIHTFDSGESGGHASSAFIGNQTENYNNNWEKFRSEQTTDWHANMSRRHLNLEFDDLDRVSLGQEFDRAYRRKYVTTRTGQRIYKTYRIRKASQHFDGKIADFTMWQSALTNTDVYKLYNSRYGTSEVGKWFNEASTSSREMITYGQWLIHKNITQSPVDINDVLEQGLSREVTTEATMYEIDSEGNPTGNIITHDGEPNTQIVVSGSYAMEGIIKRPIKHQSGAAYRIGVRSGFKGTKSLYKTYHNGTRTGLEHDLSTSRTLFNAIPGVDMIEPHKDFGRERRGLDSTELEVFEAPREESPYILYPTDNLVFGWQCATPFDFKRTTNDGTGPHLTLGQNASEDVPTRMKITLYGSYLQDGKGRQDNLNQNLTSDAVHEALHFESPGYDQFQLEDPGYMYGTYMDNIVSGSMFVNEVYGKELFGKYDEQGFRAGYVPFRKKKTPSALMLRRVKWIRARALIRSRYISALRRKMAPPLPKRSRVPNSIKEDKKRGVIARRRIASIADTTQKTIGSMLRGVRLIDNRERYFDSIVAPPAKYHAFNGNGVLRWSSPLFRGGQQQTSLVFGEPRPSDEKVIVPEKTNIMCQRDGWYQPVPKGVVKLTFRRLWTADHAFGSNLEVSSGIAGEDLVNAPQPEISEGWYAGAGYSPVSESGAIIDPDFTIASEGDYGGGSRYDSTDVTWYISKTSSLDDVDGDSETQSKYVYAYIPYAQGMNYIDSDRAREVGADTESPVTAYIEIHNADNKKYAVWLNWNNGASSPDDNSTDSTSEYIDEVISVNLDINDGTLWQEASSIDDLEGKAPADVINVFGTATDLSESRELFPFGSKYMSAEAFANQVASALSDHDDFELLYNESSETYSFSEGIDADGEERYSIYIRTTTYGLTSPVDNTVYRYGGGIPGVHYKQAGAKATALWYPRMAYIRGWNNKSYGDNPELAPTWQTADWHIDSTKGYDWHGKPYKSFSIVHCTYQAEELANDYRLMSNGWGIAHNISEFVSLGDKDGQSIDAIENAADASDSEYTILIDSTALSSELGISGAGVDDYIANLRPNNLAQFLHQSDVTEESADGFVRVSGYTIDGTWIQIHDAKDNAYNIFYYVSGGSYPPAPTSEGTLVYIKPQPGSPASTIAELTAEVLGTFTKSFKTTYEPGDNFFTLENVEDGSTKDADSTIMGLPLTTGFYLVDENGTEYDNEYSFWSFMWSPAAFVWTTSGYRPRGTVSFSKTVVDSETYTSGNTPEDPEPFWHGDPIVEGVDPYHENTNSLIDAYWLGSYPFESRYSSLARGKWRRSSEPWNVTTWDEETGEFEETAESAKFYSTVIITGSNMPSIIEDPTLDDDPSYPVLTVIGDGTSYAPNTSLRVADDTKNNFYKFYFGSGDNWQKNPAVEIEYLYSDGYTWPSAVPKIRGWKYGLISALPANSSAVFRHDSYGQFRDMLEQRPFTRFFKTLKRGKFKGRSRISAPAVRVRFVDNDGALTRPDNTWSQNLSAFCTSSLPFFDDGQARNRELDVDELDSSVITVRSLL